MNNLNNRQKGAEWFKEMSKTAFFVIGAGGIGSWFTLLASRMNPFRLMVIDADTIEEHNIGGQWYSRHQIGEYKVHALSKNCQEFSNYKISFINQWFTTESTIQINRVNDALLNDDVERVIVVLALDSIEARKTAVDIFKNHLKSDKMIILDIRLRADFYQIIPILNDADLKYWTENHHFPASDVEELPCTFRQTSYLAAQCTGHALSLITNYYEVGMIPRYVDFSTTLLQSTTEWNS